MKNLEDAGGERNLGGRRGADTRNHLEDAGVEEAAGGDPEEGARDVVGGRRGRSKGRQRTVGVEEWGIWRAREGWRRQCEGNKYVDSNGAPPPGAP